MDHYVGSTDFVFSHAGSAHYVAYLWKSVPVFTILQSFLLFGGFSSLFLPVPKCSDQEC